MAKKQQHMTTGVNGRGFTNWMSPQYRAFSRDLLDEKSKVPAIPLGWGLWLQMTSALR